MLMYISQIKIFSYFPYDQQNCKLTISSWTSSKSDIDYMPEYESVNLDNFIPNEEWVVVSFNVKRVEQKFVCCPEPWVLLEASLVVRRKPLYYIVNLVIPTSVITLVAVTGFFTAASTSSERREKLSLGIDSLLAMSILMMMVSEQMPTTSEGVPLFGLFYLTIIFIIFIGTLFTAFVLNVHLQKIYSKPVPPIISFIFFHKMTEWLHMQPPTQLIELWEETGVRYGVTKQIAKQRAKQYKDKANEKRFRQIPSTVSQQAATVDGVKRTQARENWRRLTKRISEKSRDGTLPSPLTLTLPQPRQVRIEKDHRQLARLHYNETCNIKILGKVRLIYIVVLLNISFIQFKYELLIESFKFRARPPSICFDDIPSVLMHSSSEMSATENNLFESKLKRRYFKLFIIYSNKLEF
ncbi:hypothetical protein WR25_22537 isoform F [Diploscapter pachys]|uniref:Neurotransmitter-gated ion-channel transmembrane domain-containing protein n=1 Tax=Diploscapter pachys TaxID=2018661 RepID=A0A2A2JXZ8_9BILA|nr:hypothetical protein WR25_22537 isoform C [Diploscapter pachys]PAV66526.1 hypothetical protein WR25_22537 isoform F [Diploscapter pachys]